MKLPLHLLLPDITGIPVLMYHKVWEGTNDRLTISPENLTVHFNYLKENGYHSLSLQDFLAVTKGERERPEKCFLLTFDDGYVNNLTLAYPIIRAFNFKATYFIIGNTLDGTAPQESAETDQKMDVAALQQLDSEIVQLALHTQNHIHFGKYNLDELKADLSANVASFDQSGLAYHKVLAYPFGGRPKDKKIFTHLKEWMAEQGIEAAFRIGNKPCKTPATEPFELKRIDIWGTDTVADFAVKLRKGKLKPF